MFYAVRTGKQLRVAGRPARPWLMGAILVAFLSLCAPSARAAPTESEKAQAAAAYDEGVALFERASYAAAAAAFLRADQSAPSAEALSSALVAARKSNDHLLLVAAAERAISRDATDPKLAANGRALLLEAARHLARLEASCDPRSCALTLDGAEVQPGSRYVLPGTHTLTATFSGGARAEERVQLEAGATYRMVLHPTVASGQARASERTTSTAPATQGQARKPSSDRQASASKRKPLSPVVFYAGAALTIALAAVTTWSGLDTLSARNALPARPRQSQIDDVEGKIKRTDFLLGGAIIAGAATTYVGLALVDWDGAPSAKNGGKFQLWGRF